MSTTNRIVLLSTQGDELFSGSSLLADADADAPPPTLRAAAPVSTVTRRRDEVEIEVDIDLDADADQGEHVTCDAPVDDDEPVPETLRSSVLMRTHAPVSRPIIIEMAEDYRAA